MVALDQPADLKISLKGRPDALAADVEADPQLCAVKTCVSMPADFMVDFTHRDTVSHETGP